MITHIRVQNFKSWQDSDKVELAPLTGFFGTNSPSKNNLLQKSDSKADKYIGK